LLRRMVADPGELQLAVSEAGGASRLLHDGPKKTERLGARLEINLPPGLSFYEFELSYAANDALIFARESWGLLEGADLSPLMKENGAGRRESRLLERASSEKDPLARAIWSFFRECVVYQFHDTSFASGMRRKSSLADGKLLRRDGSNIAAFLYHLSQGTLKERQAFQRIQDAVRQVLPFFAEFALMPENGYLLLQWRERGGEEIFAASQASDGMLRVLALIALLCQPTESLPAVLILDEPELGLHPQAIMLLGALIRNASAHCQIMAATQSAPLVDEFALDEIVVLSRPGRESTLHRLAKQDYEAWLEEYTTGELWRKNVLEGGPGR
jgi:predicted ATPase